MILLRGVCHIYSLSHEVMSMYRHIYRYIAVYLGRDWALMDTGTWAFVDVGIRECGHP